MKLVEFIEENREVLESNISALCGIDISNDDEEIERWIMNDEGLYNWALQNGVYDI